VVGRIRNPVVLKTVVQRCDDAYVELWPFPQRIYRVRERQLRGRIIGGSSSLDFAVLCCALANLANKISPSPRSHSSARADAMPKKVNRKAHQFGHLLNCARHQLYDVGSTTRVRGRPNHFITIQERCSAHHV
jgi:hypothetical protein